MLRVLIALAVLLLSSAVAARGVAANDTGTTFRIVFTSNLNGEFWPCQH